MPCLPVDSASSCSSQARTPAMRGRGDDGHLVAAATRERAHDGAEQRRPGCPPAARSRSRSGPSRCVAVRGSARTSMPHRRRGHHARNPRAPSSGRRCWAGRRRRRRKLVALGDLLQRRAGIGDRDEMRPGRLAPAPDAARSKKYCLRMLGSSVPPDLLDTMNSVLAPRSIWLLECLRSAPGRWSRAPGARAQARLRAEGLREDLGTEARAAHAEQQHVGEVPPAHLLGKRLKLVEATRAARPTMVEPAEPVRLVAAGPQVASPAHRRRTLPCSAPVLERGS